MFVQVDIGFTPKNIKYFGPPIETVGMGIWTLEDIGNKGFCVMPMFMTDDASLTEDDDIYENFFVASDLIFTSVRFLTLFGLAFGLGAVTYSWSRVFSIFQNKRGNLVTLNLNLIAFICEGLKTGLLFVSAPCTAGDFWLNVDQDEVESYRSADQCWIGRGCCMSASALGIYFLCAIYIVLAMAFKDFTHEEDSFLYDDVSMPSFLQSIGNSTLSSKNSRFSRGSRNSKNRSNGESSGLTPRS